MRKFIQCFFVSITVVGLAGIEARSQSLAQSVLEEYFADLASYGVTVASAQKSTSDGVITWKDVKLDINEGNGDVLIPWLTAQEVGDDTVSFAFAPEITILGSPNNSDLDQGDAKAKIFLRSSNATYLISGPANQRSHSIKTGRLEVESITEGAPVAMVLVAENLTSQYLRTSVDTVNYAGNFEFDAANMDFAIDDGKVKVSSKTNYAGVSGTFNVDAVSPETAEMFLSGGRGFQFDYHVDSATSSGDIEQPDFVGSFDLSQGESEAELSLRDGMFSMSGNGQKVHYGLDMSKMGMLPFAMDVDDVEIALTIPLVQADAAAPADLLMSLNHLTMSDSVWGMFDPAGTIPRDAAQLNIDLGVLLKWLINPSEMALPENAGAVPVQVENIEIRDLTLALAGALFTANGAAVLDNRNPVPVPTGEVNLDLKGGFGLLAKLTDLGLVPPEQAMGARMMLGAIAIPGDGEDHLVSDIDMRADGSIYANGQRIK